MASVPTLLILLFSIVIFFIGRFSINKLVNRIGLERKVNDTRIHYVSVVLNIFWTLVSVAVTSILVGIDFTDFGLFFSSLFAVLGIALFAQWSILSNVTASIMIFFFFPYRVGNHVKFIDGDDSIEGVIKEITLFHVILLDEEENLLTYPNSMAFQKGVKISSKVKLIEQKNEESNNR